MDGRASSRAEVGDGLGGGNKCNMFCGHVDGQISKGGAGDIRAFSRVDGGG